jgi:predicted  nucleic acid-binding Zn-ribbon protein
VTSPAYAAGEQAIAALEADLADARSAIESLQSATDASMPSEELSALTQKLGTASEHLNELDLAISLIKARESAMQVALTTLAPMPPPPAPR